MTISLIMYPCTLNIISFEVLIICWQTFQLSLLTLQRYKKKCIIQVSSCLALHFYFTIFISPMALGQGNYFARFRFKNSWAHLKQSSLRPPLIVTCAEFIFYTFLQEHKFLSPSQLNIRLYSRYLTNLCNRRVPFILENSGK